MEAYLQPVWTPHPNLRLIGILDGVLAIDLCASVILHFIGIASYQNNLLFVILFFFFAIYLRALFSQCQRYVLLQLSFASRSAGRLLCYFLFCFMSPIYVMKTRKPRGRDMNLDVECPSLCLLFFFSRFGGDQNGQWTSTGFGFCCSFLDHH